MNPAPDPWISTLSQLHNNYQQEYYAVFGTPKIKLKINEAVGLNKNYILTLYEEVDSISPVSFRSIKFDKCIKWASNILKNWDGVSQHNPNTWVFSKIETLEQFSILYTLSSCNK